jgi:hypothetical protein
MAGPKLVLNPAWLVFHGVAFQGVVFQGAAFQGVVFQVVFQGAGEVNAAGLVQGVANWFTGVKFVPVERAGLKPAL